MVPKRGQPPKSPEERKGIQKSVSFTRKQIAAVESAKKKESPESRISTYIRDVVVSHAENVIDKK